jgi:hypothetical protein
MEKMFCIEFLYNTYRDVIRCTNKQDLANTIMTRLSSLIFAKIGVDEKFICSTRLLTLIVITEFDFNKESISKYTLLDLMLNNEALKPCFTKRFIKEEMLFKIDIDYELLKNVRSEELTKTIRTSMVNNSISNLLKNNKDDPLISVLALKYKDILSSTHKHLISDNVELGDKYEVLISLIDNAVFTSDNEFHLILETISQAKALPLPKPKLLTIAGKKISDVDDFLDFIPSTREYCSKVTDIYYKTMPRETVCIYITDDHAPTIEEKNAELEQLFTKYAIIVRLGMGQFRHNMFNSEISEIYCDKYQSNDNESESEFDKAIAKFINLKI